jgi:hypothetical protein
VQIVLAKIEYITPNIQIHPNRTGREVCKSMTMNEFGEINEVWVELRAIYDEIDALNAGSLPAIGFGEYTAARASAQ